jgi:hypothetical protein
MASPATMIEVQLRLAANKATVNGARKQLNEIVASLSPDQALAVLQSLLAPPRDPARISAVDRVPQAVRLELLVGLQGRLDRAKAIGLQEDLTVASGADASDLKLQEGLKAMFPRADEQDARKKFLEALRAPPGATTPSVLLVFRNRHTFSPDNNCTVVRDPQYRQKWDIPDKLGLHPRDGRNFMEIRGIVTSFMLGYHYFDFTRKIEMRAWYREGGDWKEEQRTDPDHVDDDTDADESVYPEHGSIYVVDGPGPLRMGPSAYDLITRAQEYVFMMKAVETVRAKTSWMSAWTDLDSLEWFSVTWLVKQRDGRFARKAGANEISLGTLPDFDTPTGEPPSSW